jgi:DNA-directed RNA polymerase specialized sigma subunit
MTNTKTFETRGVARAVLTALPQIDNYCRFVSKTNMARAIDSFESPESAETIMERIIEKTYLIQQLHNIKIKTLAILKDAPEKIAQIADLYFVKGETPKMIAEKLDLTTRTLYRQVDATIEWFEHHLEATGITPSVFKNIVSRSNWMRAIYADSVDKE